MKRSMRGAAFDEWRLAVPGELKAVGVTTTHSRDSLAAESPHLVVDSLAELTIPALAALW